MLALAFWLHMVATVVWIGGLFFQSVFLYPALRQVERPGELLQTLQRRFQPLAWLSLVVLVGTGLLQMSANDSYQGLLSVSNPWSRAILAKHIAIGLMVLVAAYQTWYLQPEIARLALLGGDTSKTSLHRRFSRLGLLNLVFGIIVLGLTGLARTR